MDIEIRRLIFTDIIPNYYKLPNSKMSIYETLYETLYMPQTLL